MSKDKKKTYDYLIIGGGVVAGYAAEGIREEDQSGTIGIVSNDVDGPYTRPALTKKIWTDSEFTEADVPFNTAEETNTDVILETTVTAINRDKHTVQLEDGSSIGYKKLLLATGAKPATIDGPEDEHVIPFRTFADYRQLKEFSGDNQHVIVVGGSFIGTELAAALIQNNTKVTFAYPQKILTDDKFPEELAKEYENSYREAGVEMIPNVKAESYSKEDNKIIVQLDNGETISGDTLVLGLGVTPHLSLAKEAELEVDDGVIVNEYLQTSDPDIFAAGDISSYPDPILGRNRIEHVDHARKSGAVVGRNMTGAQQPYDHTPYFYSVVFSTSWEAIGKMDPTLDTLIDEVNDGKVVYYIDHDTLVGILVWNIEVDLNEVRQLLKTPPANLDELKGAIRPQK